LSGNVRIRICKVIRNCDRIRRMLADVRSVCGHVHTSLVHIFNLFVLVLLGLVPGMAYDTQQAGGDMNTAYMGQMSAYQQQQQQLGLLTYNL